MLFAVSPIIPIYQLNGAPREVRGRTADLGEALAEEEALITVETMQDQRFIVHPVGGCKFIARQKTKPGWNKRQQQRCAQKYQE